MRAFRTLVLVALLSGPAAAQQTATPPITTAAAITAASERDKVVCREGQPLMGSRFRGPRICKMQREWDDIRERARHSLAKFQLHGCSSGSCN